MTWWEGGIVLSVCLLSGESQGRLVTGGCLDAVWALSGRAGHLGPAGDRQTRLVGWAEGNVRSEKRLTPAEGQQRRRRRRRLENHLSCELPVRVWVGGVR